MKNNKLKFVIVLSVALVTCLAFSITAFATGGLVSIISSSWERVYPASTNMLSSPINDEIRIDTFNYGATHLDVRMLDNHGNVIWSECCAVDCHESRTFYCGPDVYVIEARSHWSGINITDKKIQVTATLM